MAVADDLDRATDSQWDWVAEQTRTYLTSGGTEGHESNGVYTLILATTGPQDRRQPRRTCLIYGTSGEDLVVVASKAGADEDPAWFKNLEADPSVGRARSANPPLHGSRPGRDLRPSGGSLWTRMAKIFPLYDEYAAEKTDREIPIVLLTPQDSTFAFGAFPGFEGVSQYLERQGLPDVLDACQPVSSFTGSPRRKERKPMADSRFTTHTDLFDLRGKNALVTGGTKGIGMMIARGLLQAGARVIISSRKADTCAEAQRLLSEFGDVQAIPADLSTHDECQRLADLVQADSDRLDILVNNAGAMWREPLETFPDEAWDTVLDLNLKSPFWLVQALLPALRRAGTAEDPARVVNIGSIAAIHVAESPNYSYASSKAGLHQLTRVLARELGPQHVTVNAVAPGPFPSQMMASTLDAVGDTIAATAPLRRLGRDDDMAGIAVFLASRAGSYLTGTIIPVDGGIATPHGA